MGYKADETDIAAENVSVMYLEVLDSIERKATHLTSMTFKLCSVRIKTDIIEGLIQQVFIWSLFLAIKLWSSFT